MASSRRSSIKNHDAILRANYSLSTTLATLFIVITTIISISRLANSVPTSYTLNVVSGFPLSIPLQVTCQPGSGPVIADKLLKTGDTLTFSFNVDHDSGVPIGGIYCRLSSPKAEAYAQLFDYDRDVGGGRCAGNTCLWAASNTGVSQYFNGRYNLIFQWP